MFNLIMRIRYLINKITGTWRRRWVKAGLLVYDCHSVQQKVVKVNRWHDEVVLEDGSEHSIDHCLGRQMIAWLRIENIDN